MASSQVSSPVSPALPQVSFASLERRIVAHLIDILIAIAVTMAAGFLVRWLRGLGVWTAPTVQTAEANPVMLWQGMTAAAKTATIICFIVMMGPIYLALFQTSAWQASVGKRILNIYVTDTTGKRLGLGRSLARELAKNIFNLFYLGFISLVTVMASARKQALHDFATNTVVVKGRPSGSGSPELWRIVAGFGIQFIWFVVTMVAILRTSG